jgi:hypothetical protein
VLRAHFLSLPWGEDNREGRERPRRAGRRGAAGLISTNGERFDHPDHAAIAKVIAAYEDPVTFFCNYRTVRTEPREKKGPAVGATFKFPKANQNFIRVTA